MKLSMQEEIICALWVVAALTSFGNGFVAWGLVFSVKATFDFLASVYFAFKEAGRG